VRTIQGHFRLSYSDTCHSHRDLKPENLLLSAAGTLKISDFGLSSVYMLKETGRRRKLTERCGSLPYVAPELSTEDPYEAEPIDVWGVGVILFTLLLGSKHHLGSAAPNILNSWHHRYPLGRAHKEE
jgi:serine/threonine protein kinase